MITDDRLTTDTPSDHQDEVFDLEHPRRSIPSRRRLVRVAIAAALALAVTIVAAIFLQPDSGATSTPPPPSFELVDPSVASQLAAEPAPPAAAPIEASAPAPAVPATAPITDAAATPDAAGLTATGPSVVPRGAAAFTAAPPTRVLDTRDDVGATPDAEFTIDVSGIDSAVFSVSVIDTVRAGAVLFDGGRGAVEALRLPAAGATTTNLTIVPVADGEVTVRSSAGGHLVIDLVGSFEPVDSPVAAGRFVAVERYRIGRLVTAEEGRELDLPLTGRAWVDDVAYDTEGSQTLGDEYDLSGSSAVVALITADVAGEGGTIRLGADHDGYDQMLMWGPASGDDRIRQGLAILTPAGGHLAALRYDGGSELTVEVLGYFTGDGASESDAGLLLAPRPQTLVVTEIPAGSNRIVGGFDRGASSAIVTLNPTSGVPGRLGASVITVADGAGSIWTRDDVAVSVALLAEFR